MPKLLQSTAGWLIAWVTRRFNHLAKALSQPVRGQTLTGAVLDLSRSKTDLIAENALLRHQLVLTDGAAIDYDLLSIDIGSTSARRAPRRLLTLPGSPSCLWSRHRAAVASPVSLPAQPLVAGDDDRLGPAVHVQLRKDG